MKTVKQLIIIIATTIILAGCTGEKPTNEQHILLKFTDGSIPGLAAVDGSNVEDNFNSGSPFVAVQTGLIIKSVKFNSPGQADRVYLPSEKGSANEVQLNGLRIPADVQFVAGSAVAEGSRQESGVKLADPQNGGSRTQSRASLTST
jgi:hypothetical protein